MVRGEFLISTLYLQYRVHCSSDCALRYPLCSIRTMNLNCIRFFSTKGFYVFEKTRFQIPPLIILRLEVCDTGNFFWLQSFLISRIQKLPRRILSYVYSANIHTSAPGTIIIPRIQGVVVRVCLGLGVESPV